MLDGRQLFLDFNVVGASRQSLATSPRAVSLPPYLPTAFCRPSSGAASTRFPSLDRSRIPPDARRPPSSLRLDLRRACKTTETTV
jgi:hypothetical protein